MFRSLLICLTGLTIGTATLAADDPSHSAPPPLRETGDYLTHVETVIFSGPPSRVRHAVQSPTHGVLANVKATDRIPQVTGTTPITGQFPDTGSVRQVNMAGGFTATERMIENGPDGFRYQVWDLTAPSARLIEHIVGEFSYRALDDGRTEVTWSYSVAPRTFVARPFIRRFLDNDFAPFMQGGLNGAAAQFNTGG